MQLLRRCGLAARFVSGYLIQLTPDVKSLDGPSGTSVDFTDLHAWCEVYLPGAGWVGLDPTSGLLAGEGHIPLACTPQPSGAAPIEGVVDDAEVEFSHHMVVTRIHESPRVTKPYTESQWAQVLALGEAVDLQLQAGDVRLTMGGEPTFVAVADRDATEWNIDAMGPTKRSYAVDLVHKLRDQYGRGGFLHFGQGKWYPGEQLPRWALSICWRADGKPVWNDPALFADERRDARYTSVDAGRFTKALAQRLGLADRFIQPGYEDALYYLWRERRLPVNVDPFDARLDDELERVRLRRVFERRLDSVVGYVLPLRARAEDEPDPHGPQWATGPWFLRDERMYLIPGDSPMGYRLPLDSLPWSAPGDQQLLIERDPMAARGALPATEPAYRLQTPTAAVFPDARPGADHYPAPPARSESAKQQIRTALCVEARDPARANGPGVEAVALAEGGTRGGLLYVFMPPLARLEDYLDLLAAVEATAQALGVKIVLEGYAPPRDPRLKLLQVTPDPGVIEVNIHPAHHWGELVQHTEFLYQAAFETRLSAEKFMTDGRHTGTGGGNHFVLGGATPADSPFLRKPELLASLLLYWHNHPALSYLFSGMFIGPTSQAPRVDEARNDQLYELEIALRELERYRADNDDGSALAGGPRSAQHPGRHDRQHPPQRVLHRQAVLARQRNRPARPAGAAGIRDAAACAHEHRAAIADPRAGGEVLETALSGQRHALGHHAARSLPAAQLRQDGPGRRDRRDERGGLRLRRIVVRAAFRVPLSDGGRGAGPGDRADLAQRTGAVARDGRAGRAGRDRALRRLVAGAHRSPRHRPER